MKYLVPCRCRPVFLPINASVIFNKMVDTRMKEAIHTESEHGTVLPASKTVQNNRHNYFLPTCLPKNNLYHICRMEQNRTFTLTNITI